MNQVQLLGNVVRDVAVRYTANGKAWAGFTVAASSVYVDSKTGEAKEQTAFVNCVAWGQLAEYVSQCKKGQRIFVQGRINVRSYDGQDGVKRYVTEVVAGFISGAAQEKEKSNFDCMQADEEIPF